MGVSVLNGRRVQRSYDPSALFQTATLVENKSHHLLIYLSVQVLTLLTGSVLIEIFYQYNQLTDSFLSTMTQVKVIDRFSDQNSISH